jgi:hypothetical protein
LPEINLIFDGTSIGGDRGNRNRKYTKQVFTTARLPNMWHEPIIFTPVDGKGVTFPHEDALVISTFLANHHIHRVLVDDDSVVNILYSYTVAQIGIDPLRLTPVKTPLIEIVGTDILIKGALEILITICTFLKCLSL